ncbi:polysaccharide lyase 8 family protein [Streptomyces sp. NPDC051452]|uniref:polysaccharide lyase 8 family protein n=1 Tax=Streptomyces sp. NPDC051452 TaxID=3365654 RepID=UPI0037883CC4
MGMTRRALLLAAALLTAPAPGARAAGEPYDPLRRRWLGLALGSGFDPGAEPYASRLAELGARARDFAATMAPTATSLWPGHPFDPPSGITFGYDRLWTMAQAYVQPGTGSTGDPALLADVLRGLDHLSATVYHPATTPYGNWWEWRIGSPRLLMDITAALYERIGDDRIAAACAAVDHFVPDPLLTDYSGVSTGANRVDLCRCVALRGVLGRDPGRLSLARDALSPVFTYATEGDGLYADGSFVQHTRVAYSGTYGQVLLDGLGRLTTLLAGSPWEVTDPARQHVLDAVEHAWAPLIHDGLVMDCVNGRAISRGWLRGDDERVMRGDHFHGHALIAAMDRAVHRGPRFTAALSMASDRIAHYECGNGENPRGWHTGSGMLSWWPSGQGEQYTDWYWPTVDWYRLPGTTVSTRRLADRAGGEWGAPRPDVRWVGGTTDGTSAVVGQHLKGLGSTLEARKSWVFLPDAVICLGAGISCADGVPVETIVDSRNLGEGGTQAFVHAGRWAHLEGHGGWVLPHGGALRTLREDRTGAWSDINTGGTAQRRTRRRQTLWLDHGIDPVAARYAYVLLPGASRAETAALAADRRRLTVLANDSACQAVAVARPDLIAATFWRAGTVGELTVSAGAAVLVVRRGPTATLHVSEPPRTGEPLEIVWDHPVRAVNRADDSVQILSSGRRLRVRVTPGMACATHECEVALR